MADDKKEKESSKGKGKIKSFNISTQLDDGKVVKASVKKISEADLGKTVKLKIYSDVVSDGKPKIVASEVDLKIGEEGTIPPPEPHVCPPNQHWDDATGQCVEDVVIPPPPITADLILGASGDTEDGQEADTIFGRIAAEKVDKYLFLGDSSYNANDADAWCALIDKNNLKPIIILSQGNHEHIENDSQQCEVDIEAWMPSLKATPEVATDQPSWEKTKWISGQQVKNSYIISMNSQDQDRVFKRNQYVWTEKQLNIAKALKVEGKIDWIIVLIHKPWYSLKSSHGPEKEVRDIYQPLFEAFQVDFVLHGHVHNIQNWLPLTTNATQLFTKLPDGTFDFKQPHGQFFLVSGAGGHEHNSFSEDPKLNTNVFFANADNFGYTMFYIKDKNAIVQTKDITGKVINEFKVTKGEPEPSKCPPGQHWDGVQCIPDVFVPPECPAGEHYDSVAGKCVPDSVTPPPVGELDDNGVKMLHKTTGKYVDQLVGGDPAGNGQRYSVNHKYQNYMLIGYWKTGPNQELIEHKTDGPNHGSCTQLPKCCWTEPAIELATGKSHFSSEWPHPKNHPPGPCPSMVSLNMNLQNKWIGYAVVAYQDGEFRTVEQWCDPTGLSADGKPNNNWKLTFKETDKGQITNPELAKRPMFVEGRGMESEIRMHGDTGKHGVTTDMKFARVYELVTPIQ